MNKTHGFTLIELLVVISILGLISSVALANLQEAKTQAQVAAGQQFHAMVGRSLGDRVVARWEFDEGSGGVSFDSSGSGLDGSIVGATYVSNGIAGGALSFDGNDRIVGDSFPDPGTNGQLTIAGWLRPTNVAANNTIISIGDANCTSVQVSVVGGRGYSAASEYELIPVLEGDETPITDDRVIVNNAWQNIVLVYDAGTVQTFINGVEKDSVTGVGTTSCTGGGWTIGAEPDFGNGYQGLMDSVSVFDTAITASEAQAIYAAGPGSPTFVFNK